MAWNDSDIIIVINVEQGLVQGNKRVDITTVDIKRQHVFIEGGLFCDQLLQVAEATHFTENYNGLENGIIAAYQHWEWEAFLQIADLDEILKLKRFVFIVGEMGVKKCYEDLTMPVPAQGFNLSGKPLSLFQIMHSTVEERIKEANEVYAILSEKYQKQSDAMEQRIKERKPRILFWTSRFTTVLQYHTKSSMEAAMRLGCQCRLLIEPSDIKRLTDCYVIKNIDEFEPDVVFMLDHFRYEHDSYAPKELVWVTWIQDPMPHIMSAETVKKIKGNDILLSHFISYENFKQLYPGRLVDAAIPANEEVYKPYDLTEEEKELYGCDICFVCHASDVEDWVDSLFENYNMDAQARKVVGKAIQKYQKAAYEGKFIYEEEEFYKFLVEAFAEQGFTANEDVTYEIAAKMNMWLSQRVFRQCLVDWIIDAGFTNIKLWGNGWQSEPKYAKYAMGPAENGETLSKIYQASKVVLGNNIKTTAAARAWESMLSGAFYLSNVIPEGADWCDIHKIMPEGTVEYFHNKEELIEKLHFYLEHDDERKRMAEIGRQEALKRMTFTALMENVLDILPEYIDDDK